MSWNLPPGCTQAEVDGDDPYREARQEAGDGCAKCGTELTENREADVVCLNCDIGTENRRTNLALRTRTDIVEHNLEAALYRVAELIEQHPRLKACLLAYRQRRKNCEDLERKLEQSEKPGQDMMAERLALRAMLAGERKLALILVDQIWGAP